MKKHSLSENILICLAAAFVGGVWQYELYFGQTVHLIMSVGSLIFTAVIWTLTSFSEGRQKRTCFAIFTLLFYILPQIPIIYADYADYNEILDALARLCALFTRFGGSAAYPAVICGLSIAAFIVGRFTKAKSSESKGNAD